MINKQKIKKLAVLSSEGQSVPKDIANYVLNFMSKEELKEYLRFLKIELDKKRVYVVSSDRLTGETINNLKNQFKEKDIIEQIDESLGGGIIVKNNDLVIDFSVKKYINDTIEKIKN